MNAIVQSLDRAIRDGKYPPPKRLPSERELAKRFGVPLTVARAAMNKLAAQGLVHRVPRGGTFANVKLSGAMEESEAFPLHCVNFIEPVRKQMDSFAFALANYLHGYTRALQDRPLRVRFASLPLEGARFNAVVNPALPLEGQGCVIGDILDPGLMAWLDEKNLPFVIRRHSFYDHNEYPAHNGVYLHRNGASHKATLHLMDLGHRRIGYVGQVGDESKRSRWSLDWTASHDGYRAALYVKGIPTRLDYEVDVFGGSLEDTARAAAPLLRRADHPTGIVCQNDLTAFGVIRAANELGLKVPRDVSVIGFDNDPAGAEADPPLTTFGGHEELAVAAIERLFEMVKEENPPPAVHPVECPMIVRQSTAPAVRQQAGRIREPEEERLRS